jgi:N-acetylneuraminate lyase
MAALFLVLGAGAFDLDAHRITSTMAAVYTPMTSTGDVDLGRIPQYAAHLAARNITNVMPAGTNGESLSLTVDERKQLAEAWGKAGIAHGVKVYMHIGAECLRDARTLAAHAATTAGVSGILAMSPVYFKPSAETLFEFLAEIAEAAPELPFWYYHFPHQAGVLQGSAYKLLELAERSGRMPNLAGIKFTDYDLIDFRLCAQASGGKYNMLFGRDEMLLEVLPIGKHTVGASSTVNYSPTLRDVVRYYTAGDLASAERAQQANANLCSHFGSFSDEAKDVQKALMRVAGFDVGPPRLPFRDITADDEGELRASLKSLIDKPAFPVNRDTGALVV